MKGSSNNSQYYEDKRKELVEPEKYCACCGKQMHRKYYAANGRWEDWKSFLKRKYCDVLCSNKAAGKAKIKASEDEFKKNFRSCKELEGLYVDREGNVIYNGRKKSVIKTTNRFGRKTTARILLRIDGQTRYFSVARLVAHAFKMNYEDDCKIDFLDGNIHNVCADNLKCVDKKAYNKRKMEIVSSYRKIGTYKYQVDRLQNVITEAEAVLHYFKTGDAAKINSHVQNYLYEELVEWSEKSLHLSESSAMEHVPDVIARMYEIILQGHAISHMERYCKKLLQNLKKKGWYGHEGNVPDKQIELIINSLNLDCLCKKYKVTKL